MREIDLERRKEISLDILLEIKRILEKHEIKYYLAYGTLIGAIRHKGFIPWDDDIDIWVGVDDIKRALDILMSESKYDILSLYEHRSNWNRPFAKVSDPRTIICNRDKRATVDRGVAVDVFPLFPIGNLKWSKNVLRAASMIARFSEYDLGNYNLPGGYTQSYDTCIFAF